ncbi:alanine racemase, partial [Mycobacterium tuberculosis]
PQRRASVVHRTAKTALGAGAAELGVATVDEALALRADGITAPVLAWLHPPGIDFGPALLADVQVAVSSLRQLDELFPGVVVRAEVLSHVVPLG